MNEPATALEPTHYIKRDATGVPLEVYCKMCRELIAVHKGKGLVPLPPYMDLVLRMDDGSHHTTPMCRGCALLEGMDLDWLYQCDLLEFTVEGEDFPELLARRRPVEVER